jgi:hypothetical protein
MKIFNYDKKSLDIYLYFDSIGIRKGFNLIFRDENEILERTFFCNSEDRDF